MIGRAHVPVRGPKADRYASHEDFRKIFDEIRLAYISFRFYSSAIPRRRSAALQAVLKIV
jgi:hypothetical protein